MAVNPGLDLAEAVVVGLFVAAVLYARPWSRVRARFALAGAGSAVAWLVWRLVLQLSNGENLDVDNPFLLGLSAEDAGSGVLAFLCTTLPLGLVTERDETAGKVVTAAAIAGAVALIIDRFI